MRVDPRVIEDLLDIELGGKYRDDATGFEGAAVAVLIKAGGIVDVMLTRLNPNSNDVIERWFGGDRIVEVDGDRSGIGFGR